MRYIRIIKIVIFALILIFYGSVLFHKINLPTDDLGRHLTNGKLIWENKNILYSNFYSYTEPDFSFVNHHWLSGIVFYFLFALTGFKGLVIFKIILLLVAFSLVFRVAAKKGNFWLATLASIPAIFLLSERTDVRPEIFSLLFTAFFLYVLTDFTDNPKSKKIYWLIPLQFFWVNLHIYFFIGILMVGGFLLEKIIISFKNLKNNLLVKKYLLLFFSLVAVSLINPFGYKILFYPLNMFKNYGYDIVENKSPFFLENLMHNPAIPVFKISIAILIIGFILSTLFKRFFVPFFLASLTTIIASLLAIRNFPFFGLIFLPVASISFSPLCRAQSKEKTPTALKYIFPAFIIAIFLILPSVVLKGKIFNNKERGIGLAFQSNDSADFFKQENLQGPIFNNYDIGSYLIWHLYPNEKIFVDNRPEAYSKDFFAYTYLPMQTDEIKWQKINEKYNFNIIFFTQQEGTWWGQNFLSQRLKDESWSLIYADSQAVILIKNSPENQQIIERHKITKENIIDKIIHLKDEKMNIQINGIHLLNLIGRGDLAFNWCQELSERYPREGKIWLEMGYAKSNEGRITDLIDASEYLKKAIALGEDLPAVYNQLGLVYFNLGQYEQAKNAWQEALSINPKDEHAKNYLEQLQKFNFPQIP